MDRLLIRGGVPLRGKIQVNGSKNACLPIIASTLLTRDTTIIEEVPDLLDVRTMIAVLEGPVSYTHLDVYKRQTFIFGDTASSEAAGGGGRA